MENKTRCQIRHHYDEAKRKASEGKVLLAEEHLSKADKLLEKNDDSSSTGRREKANLAHLSRTLITFYYFLVTYKEVLDIFF